MAFIDIRSVSKSFGSVAVLKNVDLQIEEGSFVVFVGPSGCGKSTLLRVISGLEDVTSGTVAIAGKVVNDIEPAARGVAMVFQSYALYPHMTVFQNVSFSLRMANKAKDFIAGKVRDAAATLRLDSLLDRRPGQLSGGQKQRVAIGRAIVREPQVFLFDEPLSNLDAELRVQMRGEIMNLHRRLGTTMIYVTHDQVEAMTLADKMVVLSAGEVQQAGKPLDLYDDPDNRFVAAFVGSPKMNFLPATVVGCDDASVNLSVPGRAAPLSLAFAGFDRSITAVEIGIRPQHLSMLADARAGADVEPVLEGTIALVEELGDVTYVHLTLADGTPVVVRGGRAAKTAANPCRFTADLTHALLFDGSGKRLHSGKGKAG